MQRFLIYIFLQMLYMFQAVPLPIIRSAKLYRFCQPILLGKQQYWLTIPEDVCYSFLLLMIGGGTA